MALVESFLGLRNKYLVATSLEDIEERLQLVNPRTGQPFFTKIQKKNTRFVKKGLWQPFLFVEKAEEATLLTFTANTKLRWLFQSLFEGITAAFVAIILTYFTIPFAAPLVYAGMLAVALPTVIFVSGVLFMRIKQQHCVANIISEINTLMNLKVSACQKIPTKIRITPRSYLAALFPSLAGIFLALIIAVGAHSLAWKYWCEGDYVNSERLCRPVQKIVNFTLGENNSIAADSNYYLAECLRCQGKNEEAALLYQKTLRETQKHLGDHIYVADSYYGLARIRDVQKNYEEAQKLYQKSIDIYVKQYPDYLNIAKIRNRLAMLFLKQSNIERAEYEQREAIRIDKLYGKRNHAIAEDLNDLGCILYHKENLQAAHKTFLKALNEKIYFFGRKHHSLYATLYNLKMLSEKLQNNKDAKLYGDWAQKCFKRYFPQASVPEGDLCVKYICKRFHHQYEIPNIFRRYNATTSLEGHY